ncbi:MAG: 30S ribosomal protein S18 [Zetaproteobacteria bacterium CG2_30_46_52]|nr:MAG: 30S ribosomal protein S18 [Zetaproteobacteria bacterium CG2_30_46_52]
MSEEKKVAPAARTERPARPEGRSEGGRPERPQRRAPGGRAGGKFKSRRKFCKFCADTSIKIDHKDPGLLGQFISERSKITPSRVTSTCAKHQRQLTTAIKRARVLALLSFTPLHHD